MCGILVAYESGWIDKARFDVARDTLIHRGPDAQRSAFLDDGRLALGHTRLSIVDLSSRAHQPMRSENLWVTFNGEIYNYPQLRQELEILGHRFTTKSDTEVLLHGYREWGETLCEKLLGMFAFAIWDEKTRQLFLGRDHFGQKPLFYTHIGDEFVAASEIKAIKSYSKKRFPLRRESIIDAMVQDFVAEPNTWFEDIKVLPAGHCMSVRRQPGGALLKRIRNYWEYRPNPNPEPISQSAALDRLGSEIDSAIRAHLLSDVEIGAFLSGGIDSTSIVTIASAILGAPMRTFSIGFGSDDELPLARQTANQIRSTHTEGMVTVDDYHASIDSALGIFDHPFTDTSLVPTERVSELAAKKVKVVLTGDGGDECFGGYNYGRFLSSALPRRPSGRSGLAGLMVSAGAWVRQCGLMALDAERRALTTRERLVSVRRLPHVRARLIPREFLASVQGYDPSQAYQIHRNPELDGFRDAQWVGIKVPLPNKMLVKVDRCSMAHSVETRAPFLWPSLVEFMLDLPRDISNPAESSYKGLLRQWLKGRISDSVLNAPKRGFSVPKSWSREELQMNKAKKEILPLCVAAGLLIPNAAEKLQVMPHILWRFRQIEKALEDGILSV